MRRVARSIEPGRHELAARETGVIEAELAQPRILLIRARP